MYFIDLPHNKTPYILNAPFLPPHDYLYLISLPDQSE